MRQPHCPVLPCRPDWIDNWSGLERAEYERKKDEVADAIVARLEKVFPGLKAGTLFRQAARVAVVGVDTGGRLVVMKWLGRVCWLGIGQHMAPVACHICLSAAACICPAGRWAPPAPTAAS